MGLVHHTPSRRARPPGVGVVDHGGNPTHLAICAQGEVNRHALRLLSARDKPCTKVEIVLRDGIVHRNGLGEVVTTWVLRDGQSGGPERVHVLGTEAGMPAFPS